MARPDKTFVVEAGRRIGLYTQWVVSSPAPLALCKVMLTATFKPNRHYLLSGSLGDEKCFVNIQNIDGSALGPDNDIRPVQTVFGFFGGCAKP
jgi:hypothetical protein